MVRYAREFGQYRNLDLGGCPACAELCYMLRGTYGREFFLYVLRNHRVPCQSIVRSFATRNVSCCRWATVQVGDALIKCERHNNGMKLYRLKTQVVDRPVSLMSNVLDPTQISATTMHLIVNREVLESNTLVCYLEPMYFMEKEEVNSVLVCTSQGIYVTHRLPQDDSQEHDDPGIVLPRLLCYIGDKPVEGVG
jgi:hypothetical protein